jgi:hypothetical protein
MAWRVTIGGVDRTTAVDSFTTAVSLNDRARATVVVGDLMPARYAEIISYAPDGVTPLFGGVILQRRFQGRNPYDPTYQLTLEVGDWFTYADWCYSTKTYPGAVTLKQVLADLVADHLAAYGISLDPAQVDGRTLAAFTWTDKRVADALRELSDRTGYVLQIDPAKRLRMFVPASIAAPVTMTEAAPHCHDITWRDSDRTPYNQIVLHCGPTGVGEATPYHWVGDGAHVYRLAGVAVPASSVWPGIVTVDNVQYPIWPPGAGPPDEGGGTTDHIEWDYAKDGGTLTFIGPTAAIDTPGADIGLTYWPQFPFTVTKSTGATPVVEHHESRPDVLAIPVGEEIAAGLLAQAQEAPREATITTDTDGFVPGQALTIDLATTRSIAGTFLITSVALTIVQDTAQGDRFWQYTLDAIDSSIYQGSYVDAWRAIAGVGAGSTTTTGGGGGGGGGAMLPLPAGQVYVGSASNQAAAVPLSGDLSITVDGVTEIAPGVILNADVAPTAGIVDTKLATLATPGKVANSATTANTSAAPDTIALRTNLGDLFARGLGADFVTAPLHTSPAALTVASGAGDITINPASTIATIPAGRRLQTAYASGFAGSGYSLSQDAARPGLSYLEVDQLTVRGTMNAYELLVHQIRATNGSIFVANTGRVKTATATGGVGGLEYAIETEGDHGFAVNDLLRAQRFTQAGGGGAVFQSDLFVTGVTSPTTFVANRQGTTAAPVPGMDYVRLGNTTDPNRQGSIYLTADDINAPYIQILDGVDAYAAWGSSAKTKGRIGQLQGSYDYTASIYGAAFGDQAGAHLSIDPFYGVRIGHGSSTKVQIDPAGNATFAGIVTATGGAIGGWLIGADIIRDVADQTGMASTATGGNDVRFYAGMTYAGRASAPFRVHKDGSLASTAGKIGGWNIIPDNLFSDEGASLAMNSKIPSIALGQPRPGGWADGNAGIWMGMSGGVAKFSVANAGNSTGFFFDGTIAEFRGDGSGATNINGGHIQAGTITATQIAAGTITGTQIAARSIAADRIVVGTLTGTEIAARAIGADRIVVGTLTGTEIAASSIGAEKLSVGTLSAISANLGTVTAGTITGVTINGTTITGGTINGTTITGVSISGSTITAAGGNIVLDSTGLNIADGGGTAKINLGGKNIYSASGRVQFASDVEIQFNLYNGGAIYGSQWLDIAGTAQIRSMPTYSSGLRAVYHRVDTDKYLAFWTGAASDRVAVLPWSPPINPLALLDVPIVSYAGIGDDREVGFVIEALADVAPAAVTRGEQGQPEGIHEHVLAVYLVEALRELDRRLKVVEGGGAPHE